MQEIVKCRRYVSAVDSENMMMITMNRKGDMRGFETLLKKCVRCRDSWLRK